jgi:hypothetical protein
MGYDIKRGKGLLSLKFTIAFLLAPLASLSLIIDKALAGNFTASCNRVKLESTLGILSANCKKKDGSSDTSNFFYHLYVTNNNGKLEWYTPKGFNDSGNFSASCSILSFDSSTAVLSAKCRKRDQSYRNSSLNLNGRISNIDGSLTYDK